MIICDFIEITANTFIGFFNFIFSLPFLKILTIVPVYVFFQRIHNQTQQRALKSISDELIKINDFIIEFVCKLDSLEANKTVDSKTTSDLYILKSKINAHLIYMNEYLSAFPYGGPLNYLYYFMFKKYLFSGPKNSIDTLEFEYQELILNDTILSLEKDFIINSELIVNDQTTITINQETIDKIVAISRNLLENLETNTRKMF